MQREDKRNNNKGKRSFNGGCSFIPHLIFSTVSLVVVVFTFGRHCFKISVPPFQCFSSSSHETNASDPRRRRLVPLLHHPQKFVSTSDSFLLLLDLKGQDRALETVIIVQVDSG